MGDTASERIFQRASPRRAATFIIFSMTLLLALACVAGTFAVRRGAVNPPSFEVSLGASRLIGGTTSFPLCPRFTPCLIDQRNEVARIYTIWVLEQPRAPGASPTISRILSIHLDDYFSTVP